MSPEQTRVSRTTIFALSTLAMLAVAAGDQVTSVEVTFTVLYAVVIAFGAWWGHRLVGIWLAGLATALSTYIELAAGEHSRLAIAWNEGGLAVVFVAIAMLVDRVHGSLASEHAQRRNALQQLRHAERLNLLGTLAAGVAHELATPLTVITTSAELIEHAPDAAARGKLVRGIVSQAERIAAIMRHLLEFGRKTASERHAIDLNDIARAGIELLSETARKRAARLTFEPNSEPVRVVANRSELEQVVSNLVLNAVQAMPEGGEVRVRVATTLRDAHQLATLSVEDTGPGIPSDALAHIFDPFYTTKSQGTGLGLSVSSEIVADHAGEIAVESAPGHGARFVVTLPASP
jgi:signal transduction histidine kinase